MASSRRLAAIMFTDMVGSTASAQANEARALRLRDEQAGLVRPLFAAHQGREVKSMGDGFLAEFDSALRAVQCAIDIQQHLHERNSQPGVAPIQLRIGVHLGDVEERERDIFGDAVNIASRIEPLAPPGGVCISGEVSSQIRNKIPNRLEKLPPTALKGLQASIDIYQVVLPWTEAGGAGLSEVNRNRIAILPLANFSQAAGDEYFADGMTDEIISTVSGISGLSVISRTSVMRYKQTSKSMTEIGRELKAGKLLEGSVRKSGNRVRITVQLIDAESDAHLWAQSYDGSIDDVFETQSEIARKIAEALKLPSPRGGGRAESPEVYPLCLQARTLWHKFTREANEQAMLLLEGALKIDPESARATAGLADCYVTAANADWVEKDEGYGKARTLARRALEQDASLPEAHFALGHVLIVDDYPAAEAELKKALTLNPSHADAHEWYAEILRGMGRVAEATREVERALELDPLPPSRAFFLATQYYFEGRNDEAIAVCNKIIQTEPGYAWAYAGRAVLTSINGERERAYRDLQTYRRLQRDEIAYKSLQARIEAHLGNKEEASRLIDEVLALEAASESPNARSETYQLSFAYALIDDRARFFPFVEGLIDHNKMDPGELRDPAYQNMASDLRFASLLQKLRKSYGISN
ncbi:MAG TPA: tetratricopeptide repeat protein [Thermoplasmata archaeon]|nr:tetratricopeptide repeat protein [Thermoplasmata archaeon]